MMSVWMQRRLRERWKVSAAFSLLRSLSIAAGLAAAASGAVAETKAMLQVDVEGRAGVKRNRLVLMNTMPDDRDVMLLISCGAKDPETYGVALDLGAGSIWSIDGETVVFSYKGSKDAIRRMDSRGEYLTLGGETAIEAFRPLFSAGAVMFAVRGKYTAAFDLGAVSEHVERFRTLCYPSRDR